MKQGSIVPGEHSLGIKVTRLLALAVASISCATGCVDLKAVGTFASESSIIAANKSAIDATFPQTVAYRYDKTYLNPNSEEFKTNETVTAAALNALNGYMTTLAQISANGVANVDPAFANIATGVRSLKVSDPKAQAVVTEANSLFDIFLDAAIRKDVKRLITSAAGPVDKITSYLVDQAQVTENTYTQAISATNTYWGNLTATTPKDIGLCKDSDVCKTVYILATERWHSQLTSLMKKKAAAEAAAAAFAKIKRDNAMLASNVNHLGATSVIKVLEADEPDLRSAIQSARTL